MANPFLTTPQTQGGGGMGIMQLLSMASNLGLMGAGGGAVDPQTATDTGTTMAQDVVTPGSETITPGMDGQTAPTMADRGTSSKSPWAALSKILIDDEMAKTETQPIEMGGPGQDTSMEPTQEPVRLGFNQDQPKEEDPTGQAMNIARGITRNQLGFGGY